MDIKTFVNKVDIEVIVSLIRERSILWNKSEESKCKVLTNAAWKEICTLLYPDFQSLSGEDKITMGKCIANRWKDANRILLARILKMRPTTKINRPSVNIDKKLRLFEQLTFLMKISQYKPQSQFIPKRHQHSLKLRRLGIPSTQFQNAGIPKGSRRRRSRRHAAEYNAAANLHNLVAQGLSANDAQNSAPAAPKRPCTYCHSHLCFGFCNGMSF